MRVLSWSVKQILDEVKTLDGQSKQFKAELTKMCWFMRGGLTLEEAYYLCPEDRELIADLIEDNLENTKRSGMPFF
jgi:hypothetical protein